MSYPNKTRQIEGLVLSSVDYKDRDQIVKMLTEDGLVSLFCKGVQNLKSKNRRLLNPYSRITVNVADRGQPQEMEYLINGSLEAFYGQIYEDLDAQAMAQVLVDVLFHTGGSGQLLEPLEKSLEALDQKQPEANARICFYLAQVLKEAGIAPNLQECAVCGNTRHIAAISLEQGGYVCADCLQTKLPNWTRQRLQGWRYLFAAGTQQQLLQAAQIWDFTMQDIYFLLEWFEEYMAVELKSIQFLRQLERIERKRESF